MRNSRTIRLFGAALAATFAVALAACSSSSDTEAARQPAGEGFPVTIEHAYGSTTIEEQPERVATVAWMNHEVPIALGVVPVGMAKAAWGDDDNNGVLPWVEEELNELGADTPVLFDETDGMDYEAIADTSPDVILASYSGLSEEEYDTLSKIAPVVAFPEVAWGTTLEDMITMNSTALGLAQEGEELNARIAEKAETSLADHPGLEGKKVLWAPVNPSDLSKIGFYTVQDSRPGFLDELGLPQPEIVAEESEKTDEFYVEVSSDVADRFSDVDVFATYGDLDGELIKQLQEDPLLSQIPAIAEGRIAVLEDSTPLAASANPSPLSIEWAVDDYFTVLEDAAAGKTAATGNSGSTGSTGDSEE